jgi:hypothetical protein
MEYNRIAAVTYARKWSGGRNPEYYDFEHIGGDCTNFVSQCVYAGSGVMNYAADGWYYTNLNNRSPSWTSVELFYKFMTANTGAGPHAADVPLREVKIGDVIQLSFDGDIFSHSLLVVQTGFSPSMTNVRIASHSYDSYGRPLNSYVFRDYRVIHIVDVGE